MRTILLLTVLPIAIVLLLAAIFLFTPDMQYQIGHNYMTGTGVPKDVNIGVSCLKRAADHGNVQAQAELGRAFLIGVPKQDYGEAVKYLSMGEAKKDSACMYLLAYANEYGLGVPQDYKKSIDLYERAIDSDGDVNEMCDLSYLLLTLPKPYANPKRACELALDCNHEGSVTTVPQWILGVANEFGLGTPRDLSQAEQWYKRAAALGDSDSHYELAILTLRKSNDAKALAQARAYLAKPASMQQIDAQLMLALLYCMDPKRPATDKDYSDLSSNLSSRGFKAYVSRLKALSSSIDRTASGIIKQAQQDSTDKSSDHLIIALSKRYGLAGPYDLKGCLSELDEAIKLGSAEATAVKAFFITDFDFGERKIEESIPLWQAAADKGIAYAQYSLGMSYARSLGVKQDWPTAIKWVEKAAQQGECEALEALGNYYSDGRGVKVDRARTVELYEKAAAKGLPAAMLDLAYLYNSDDYPDVPSDSSKSEKWFKKAADIGLQEGNYNLGSLLSESDPNRSAKAYKTAADKGHLLSQLEYGEYLDKQGSLNEARKYFTMAKSEDSENADSWLRYIDIEQVTVKQKGKSDKLVVATTKIESGTKITEKMVKTITRKPEDDESTPAIDDDTVTDIKPIIGAKIGSDISEGDYIKLSNLDVNDDSDEANDQSSD